MGEYHVVRSLRHRVHYDIYNKRGHSARVRKKPPLTQAHYVPDNEPGCG